MFDRLVFGFASRTAGRTKARRSRSAKLTRDDLVAFHRTWFVPNNALLAIVGDLTADEAFAAADKAFGSVGAAATCRRSSPSTRRRRRGASS